MKTNYWMILTLAVSTSLNAQTASNPPLVAPSPAGEEANLVPGPATVAASNVNVRGQATMHSEVVTRLTKGDAVTVLEQITLSKPKKDEPAQWARIAFPTNAHVWVRASFIEPTNKTVLPKKLNLRAGPGENFSTVGTLQRGDAVSEIVTKGDWMQIAAPPDAFAFIAAQYLRQEAVATPAEPLPAPATAVAEPAPAPVVAPAAPAVAEPAPAPAIETTASEQPAAPAPAEPAAATMQPAPAAPETAAPAPAVEEPPTRIVQREGVVRHTWSVQAPTPYALVSPDTGETINYLYTTATNLNLKRYRGLKIVVTGEEGLDARWKNTPVITIQKIHVVE